VLTGAGECLDVPRKVVVGFVLSNPDARFLAKEEPKFLLGVKHTTR
jgi:hypothetical protein